MINKGSKGEVCRYRKTLIEGAWISQESEAAQVSPVQEWVGVVSLDGRKGAISNRTRLHVCRTKLPLKTFCNPRPLNTKNGTKNATKDPKNDPKWLRIISTPLSTVCKLAAFHRQVDLQGAFVKISDFIRFKGFLVEFLENRRS